MKNKMALLALAATAWLGTTANTPVPRSVEKPLHRVGQHHDTRYCESGTERHGYGALYGRLFPPNTTG